MSNINSRAKAARVPPPPPPLNQIKIEATLNEGEAKHLVAWLRGYSGFHEPGLRALMFALGDLGL